MLLYNNLAEEAKINFTCNFHMVFMQVSTRLGIIPKNALSAFDQLDYLFKNT